MGGKKHAAGDECERNYFQKLSNGWWRECDRSAKGEGYSQKFYPVEQPGKLRNSDEHESFVPHSYAWKLPLGRSYAWKCFCLLYSVLFKKEHNGAKEGGLSFCPETAQHH